MEARVKGQAQGAGRDQGFAQGQGCDLHGSRLFVQGWMKAFVWGLRLGIGCRGITYQTG